MDTASYILLFIVACVLIAIIADRFKNPFCYPTITYQINLSGRRQPSYSECNDEWLIEHQGLNILGEFNARLREWDRNADDYLSKTWFWKAHKEELYREMRQEIIQSDYEAFRFTFVRDQTRYSQRNYQRTAYKVQNTEHVESLTLDQILSIDCALRDIGYQTTRRKYNSQNQRKLMTKELRRKIIERDNYTCQICGKYMPDEVGLHVDHIVAIKNGGRTVESNLQVLCDKCNLSKGVRQINGA